MILSLSSEALPSVSLDTLRRGARRRDVEGLELLVGTGAEPYEAPDAAPGRLNESIEDGAPSIMWLLLGPNASLTELLFWSRQAHLIGAGLVLRHTIVESPLCVPLALLHPTDPARAHRAAAWARMHDAQTCWEVRLGATDERQLEEVLDVTMPTLGHVRLRGAGPNAPSAAPGTVDPGTVLKELTLRGYSGTVALAPGDADTEADWRTWLFDAQGWGCNTAAEKRAAR